MKIRHGLGICSVLLALLSLPQLVGCTFGRAPSGVSLDIPGRSDATPWVAASGSFVAVAWGAGGGGKTDVYLAVSRDGGATFGSPVQVNETAGEARLGGELPPRVALVSRSGASDPEIVVLWTARAEKTAIKVARSGDGGRTFSGPTLLHSPAAAGDRGWPAVALDQHARIHTVWLDHREMAPDPAATPGHVHKAGAPHDGVAMAQKSGLYYASVTSGAAEDRLLAKGACYCCKTALAVGSDGSVYAAWRHVYPGNFRDMAFTMSRDGGREFSPAVRISEDGWAVDGCPDDGPAITVDARGTVHLAWPTVVGGAKPEGAIFYASTSDGRRFTSRVRIPTLGGPKPSHPQIVVDRAGRIFAAWDESVNGRRVAALREVRLHADRDPGFGEVVTLAENAMYPVLAATDNGLVTVWSTGGNQSKVQVRVLHP